DMSVNFSNTFNDVHFTCDYISLCANVIKIILLLPLCTYVLYLGYRQWRQQHSFQSHSDLYTFHLAAMELFWIFGFFCLICNKCPVISIVGNCAIRVAFYGEIFFHDLTCVERYLAVVHPVIYHGLKSTRGLRIKIISIGGVWLLSFGLTFINLGICSAYSSFPLLCLLIISILATSFCSFYALCALIRPKPGLEKGERVDRSKRRALHTIIFLWCMLCLWFVMLLLKFILGQSSLYSYIGQCLVSTVLNWFNLCSCLVLPLMFLRRTGKLSSIFNN
ncbi:hypothetical protein XENOCAPTIV_017091, partial [Xenoophorus captivus]